MTIPSTHSAAFAIPGLRRIDQISTSESRSKYIINAVCEFYGIKVQTLSSSSKKQVFVRARQIAAYLLYTFKNKNRGDSEYLSTSKIGKIVNRHHSSVVTSIQLVKFELSNKSDNPYKNEVAVIKSML